METGILHGHHGVVLLYLGLMLAQTALVLAGNKNALTTVRGKAKIPRIVLESLMLGTGVFLLAKAPEGREAYNILKILLVVAAIPLLAIGFSKMNKGLALLGLGLLLAVYGLGKTRSIMFQPEASRVQTALAALPASGSELARGQAIYEQACRRCHGADGTANWLKARNLQESRMVDEDIAKIILQGSKAVGRESGNMKPNTYLKDAEVKDLVAYVKQLRK